MGIDQSGRDNQWFIVVSDLIFGSSHQTLNPSESSMTQTLMPWHQLLLLMCQIVVVLVEKGDSLLELVVLDWTHDLTSSQTGSRRLMIQVH